jgi:hypothetical protein
MRPTCLLIACAIALACDSPQEPAQVAPLQRQGFVVFGVVRDETGLPLSGAAAEVLDGTFRGRGAVSNPNGYFSLVDVSGPMAILVWKDGYDLHQKSLDVAADLVLEFTLQRVAHADSITLGLDVAYIVLEDAPPCDPAGWDAQAPCRRLYFLAPTSGILTVVITWTGEPQLDAVITSPNGTYLGTSSELGFERIIVSASVGAGDLYEIRVNSYYGRQMFRLRADLGSG